MPKISSREAQRRSAQSRRDRQQRDRLLYTRAEVAAMYGISIASVIRMEVAGRLKGIKLGPSQNHRTLYKASQVLALAGAEVG